MAYADVMKNPPHISGAFPAHTESHSPSAVGSEKVIEHQHCRIGAETSFVRRDADARTQDVVNIQDRSFRHKAQEVICEIFE